MYFNGQPWMSESEKKDARESEIRRKERSAQEAKWYWKALSAEYGVEMTCQADIMREIDRQDTRSRTCKKCGLVLGDYDKLERHRDSTKCKKRIAEQNGNVFVPAWKEPKFCEVCKVKVQTQSWSRHVQSKRHLQLQLPKLYCPICDKNFSEKSRPKRAFKNHLKNKSHLSALKDNVSNTEIHNSLIKKMAN